MTGLQGSSERVHFDFAGSLDLARTLWAMADEVRAEMKLRSEAAQVARNKWLGTFGDQFEIRADNESTSSSNLQSALREEAQQWAQAWRAAMDEQNRRNRATRVADVRATRNFLERNVRDKILGDPAEDEVRGMTYATVPQPPHFSATVQEMRF